MSTVGYVALAILILCLVGGALITLRLAAMKRPPRPLDRLNPGEGPTRPFSREPGDPARFRGPRYYRSTGTGRAEPRRRRPDGS